MAARRYGDWVKGGILLSILPQRVTEKGKEKLYKDAGKVLKKLQDHIDKQDLPWVPLAESTVRRKGHSLVYLDTRYLRDNLVVRRIRANPRGSVVFIGGSPWKTHKPSGLKMSDLVRWLEYGTATIPPRPILRPTAEELRKDLVPSWRGWLQDLIRG